MALFQFEVWKYTGTSAASGTNTNKDVGFLSSDVVTSDPSQYPIPIPAAGSVYSYECWIKLKTSAAPDNYVENIKVWGPSNTPGTGLSIFGGIVLAANGTTPVNTVSSYATDQMDTQHYQPGNALAWTTPQSGDRLSAVGEQTDYLVLQLKVVSTAERGNIETQLLNISYDES